MKATTYLLVTILKNKILSLRKKPALLVIHIIFALSLMGLLIMYMVTDVMVPIDKKFADIRILYAIVAGVGLLSAYTHINMGLSTGGTLFTMSDVSLLFVAPVSSKKILIYGLIKQMGTTLVTAVFILFQISNINNNFDIANIDMFNIFVIYAVVLFFSQLLSIAIYIFSNGNRKRKDIIQYILYGVTAIIAFFIFLSYRESGDLLGSVLNVVDTRTFGMIPVVGWSVMYIKASIEKDILFLVIGLGLFILCSILIIIIFTSGNADYYEDVLLSTETNFNRLQAAKEGKKPNTNGKIKIRKNQVGIGYGIGANVIFYRHILEMKRKSRLILIDKYTVIMTIAVAIGSYVVKLPFTNYLILGISIYILFFSTVIGKLSVELTKPYIYMIPEKSIHKLIAASATNILKPCIDGIIIFSVVCMVSKTSPLLNLFLALAYASSGLLFISFTILCQKLLGGQPGIFISAMLGIGLLILTVAPGIILSVVGILLLPGSFAYLGTLPYSVWCVFVSVLVFLLCGDLLDNSEIDMKKNN